MFPRNYTGIDIFTMQTCKEGINLLSLSTKLSYILNSNCTSLFLSLNKELSLASLHCITELLLSGRNTAIVQVLTEKLDHGVYILTCHVLSQDCDPFLPKQVTVLLENERRRYLDINITTTMYLRIYSPW